MAEQQQVEDVAAGDVAQITVSSRIPDFWQDSPRMWFIQAEAVLYNQRLSDAAKFQLVIAKLGKQVITQVTDILLNPPESNEYEALKARLLNIYEESKSRQILIGEIDLGDQKPSQLLRRMQDLARGKVSDDTLNILWQNHLPPSVRAVLAVSDTKDVNTLATIADKVMESITPVNIAAVGSSTPGCTSDAVSIIAEIAKINLRLNSMEKSNFRRNRAQYPDITKPVSFKDPPKHAVYHHKRRRARPYTRE
ncbi:uncharacterized protein LOC126381422 [Pectinophora gossypiella]|uniref:uncharacterized protein LOC126381422 n=1 Tax=Pectinophora gossypiella TaxID=13191 RepID=UPI00214EF102|nr:uncharacterized protein LOC126381422 [Pectinophora gossypiella]